MVTIFFLALFGFVTLTTQEPTPLPHATCTRTFQKIGCFKYREDKKIFPKLLLNNRSLKSKYNRGYLINWKEFGKSIHSLACVCSSIARKEGYKYFAIRFYGECWSGSSEQEIQKMIASESSRSNKCVNPKYEACDHEVATECAGNGESNYVFLLKSEGTQAVNGGYSQWSKWSSCSATCDEGTMSRERTCTNPKPVGKGKDCSGLGASTQVKTCRRRACKDLTIKMISTGCDSTSKKYRHCTRNPTSINVNGKEYTSNKRGFNCIVLSAFTGTIEYQVHFDTHGSQSASNRFAAFLDSLSKFRIVLCTVKDEATLRLTVSARDAVTRILGSRMQLNTFRAAYVFAGYTGPGKPLWVKQRTHISQKGPLYVKFSMRYVQGVTHLKKGIGFDLLSTGCNDPGKSYHICSNNPSQILYNGEKNLSLNKRGFNVAVINIINGKVEKTVSFDTHASTAEAHKFVYFLNTLKKQRIVLATVKDDAKAKITENLISTLAKLLRIAVKPLQHRGAFAFVAYTGPGNPNWVTQEVRKSGEGPIKLHVEIPVYSEEVSLHILSTGCNDPGKYFHKCSKSPNKILYNGEKNLSLNKRGFNVAVINILNGKVEKTVAFDTHASIAEAKKFADFLNGLPNYRIVAATVKDEAKARFTDHLKSALKKILGKAPKLTAYRGAYGFVGYTGPGKPYWVKQIFALSGKGPITMDMKLPLYRADIVAKLKSTGCNDPGKNYLKCSASPNHILINGKEQSTNRRGFNVAVVDLANGKVVSTNNYDTHVSTWHSVAMAMKLNSLKRNLAVFMVVKDEATKRLTKPVENPMKKLFGSTPKLSYRGAYCAAGATTGTLPLWAQQIAALNGKGPVSLEVAFRFLRTFTFDIKMISAGYNDYRAGGHSSIKINGKEYSQNQRGVNVVVLDRITGQIISRSFDTHYAIRNSINLVTFIKSIPSHRVILISVKDEATHRLTLAARSALISIGAKVPFLTHFRSAYLLIGYKGLRRDFVQQKTGLNKGGLIRLHANIV